MAKRGMKQVWNYNQSPRQGVILRNPPSSSSGATYVSTLSRRVVKGNSPPGQQPRNYPTPQV